MDEQQIITGLTRLYEEGSRIVFWNDPQREFEDSLPEISDVTLLRLDQMGALEAKVVMERENPKARFLVYSPTHQPDPDQDWLLDMRLYSRTFRADRASIVLDQLGLQQQSLCDHIAQRMAFLRSKDRLSRTAKLIAPYDNADDIDRKILSVIVKAEQPEFFNITRTLLHALAEEHGGDIDEKPSIWDDIDKYGLANPFWEMADRTFGYSEETPSLRNLLIRLMLTDFASKLNADIPTSLQNLMLPQKHQSNAVVCMAQWRDSSTKSNSYDVLSEAVSEIIKLDDHIVNYEIEQLIDVMTFLGVEKRIASSLRGRVEDNPDTVNVENIREIALRRQDGYWASGSQPSSEDIPRSALHAVYNAVMAAADLFSLGNLYKAGLNHSTAKELYDAYTGSLFRFDQLYRHFCEFADYAEAKHWDVLKSLRAKVEDFYGNWYITNLALAWGKHLEHNGPSALLSAWKVDGISNQQRFFKRHVQPVLNQADRRKVFVIISDAFRYEAAQELTDHLNGKYRMEAKLESQLGVLPSYTTLGMAALLPHNTLSYKNTDAVLVDGLPTASLDNRAAILGAVEGIAIRANDLMEMKKEDGRAFVKQWNVIYIYHNVIDAVGDSASTEDGTFDAVRKTINELGDLTQMLVNSLSATHVVVTADHGFLFQESKPTLTDKSSLGDKPANAKAKKRYLLGQSLPKKETVWHGSTKITAGAEGDMEFWIPKGANRFHFVSGSRFVHGGAMPQEIVVPVIVVRQIKGKGKDKTKIKYAPISVLNGPYKITTNRHRFKLIQTESVSNRVKPVTLQVAIYDGDEPITNIEVVSFESTSNDMDERTKWVSLALKGGDYNKSTPYQLVLRNAETKIEESRIDVTIDLAFTNDF
ncbi:BREX-1 system phosphatase PglZ type A [Magnetovibrio blakemorei]|uniref:TIGR02687 family protein n=1 Tax=Magnetovibrio blakemorei TaxID=28181 RepID=A0A1E5Q4D0_9PROT|nr:BREX-1 system phosphatase PglZ type A [Magnetovibrio blakemorei]OEJ64561.1 TIGR02687 family protein [Magnetovibrio blakemorei]